MYVYVCTYVIINGLLLLGLDQFLEKVADEVGVLRGFEHIVVVKFDGLKIFRHGKIERFEMLVDSM